MTKPILAWPGGKRRLLKQLLPLIPQHTCYTELFCGGAALLLAKEPAKAEIINDQHLELVTLYRVVQHHCEEFLRYFKWVLVSREGFETLREQPPHLLTDIQRAARFFYLQKLAFGAKVSGKPTFGTSTTTPARLNLFRIEEDLSAVHQRLARVTVERDDWLKCLHRYDRPNTFHFADPPYWKTEGYGCAFEWKQYEALRDALDSCKGKMLITLGAHPDIERLFEGCIHQRTGIQYTVGGGKKPAQELIISNYLPRAQP